MQICTKCGGKIKYITVAYDNVVVCEAEKIVIYTERGRRVEGYAPHKCEVNNGSERENKEKDK